jgi:putative serine protease PepD
VNGSTLADIYDSVSPSVVNIAVSAQSRDVFGRPVTQEGTGSGFIIDPQGHVVTNDHVVTGADRVDVILWDGSSYVGQVIGSDPANDLAVLRIQAPPERLTQLTVAPLGDFSSVRVGQFVVAIGNPFGLERSASLGIVSSLGRTRPGLEERLITNMIQTDAAINPGNSGGPLLNLRGEVVGINAQMGVSGRSNVGIGFAIPVSTLTRYLPELLAGRAPRHAWLGVAGNSLTPTLAERLQIPVQQGVLVTRTTAGGPAARAGFRTATRADPSSGDIIVQIDGRPVRSVEDVAVIIDQRDPGDTVRVAYLREGKMETVDVTLGVWEEREAEP